MLDTTKEREVRIGIDNKDEGEYKETFEEYWITSLGARERHEGAE